MNKRKIALIISVPIILSLLLVAILSSLNPSVNPSPKTSLPPQPPPPPEPLTSYSLKFWGVMNWDTWTEQQYIDMNERVIEGKYEYAATVEFTITNIGEHDLHGLCFKYTIYNETAHYWTYGITHFTTVDHFVGDLSAEETKVFTLTDFRLTWVIKWSDSPEYQINGQLTFRYGETERGGFCLNVRWDQDQPRSRDYILDWSK